MNESVDTYQYRPYTLEYDTEKLYCIENVILEQNFQAKGERRGQLQATLKKSHFIIHLSWEDKHGQK